MVTVNDIGEASGRTWGSVRAPIWNTSGLYENAVNPALPPSSSNWSPLTGAFHSAGYPDDRTSLRKAFPVSLQLNSIESPSGAFSTSLGLNSKFVDGSYEIYLTIGTGIAVGGQYTATVLNYYPSIPPPPVLARTGYDYETTKAHLIGATVNLSYETASSSNTASVVITADLFPADMFDDTNLGIYVTTESLPVTSCYIGSVVLP